jgi:hypothetical protein
LNIDSKNKKINHNNKKGSQISEPLTNSVEFADRLSAVSIKNSKVRLYLDKKLPGSRKPSSLATTFSMTF